MSPDATGNRPEEQRELAAEYENENAFLREMSRSLVCLSGRYSWLDDNGEPTGRGTFSFTGFAFSFDGVPVLLTAGHVLADRIQPLLAGRYEGNRVRIDACFFCDTFGPNPIVREPTPFDLRGTPMTWVDQSRRMDGDGLDLGILIPRPFFWDSMRANGVEPIHEGLWSTDPAERFTHYKMLGFPEELANQEQGEVQVLMASVELVENPPPGPNGECQWFVGHLRNNHGLASPVGMSGGPIFGFRESPAGGWEYRVVGLQSWWNRDTRVIYATPLRKVTEVVGVLIEGLRRRGGASTQT
jgi:hypothetical protein